MDLTSLVESAQRGHVAAFEALVDRYYTVAYVAALNVVHDPFRAEDVTQDAFVTAWSKLGALKQPGAFPIWVRRIARNLALTWQRTEQYRERLAARYPAEKASATAGSDALEQVERKALVMNAIEALSPKLREAVVAYYLEEQSAARAAESIGVTANTLKKRLSRARTQLRAHFETEMDRQLAEDLGVRSQERRKGERVRKALALGPAFPELADRIGVEAVPSAAEWFAGRAAAQVRRVPRLAYGAGVAAVAFVAWVGVSLFGGQPKAIDESAGDGPASVSTVERVNEPSIESGDGVVAEEQAEDGESARASTLKLAADAEQEAPVTTVSGTVRDETGAPIANATVLLMLRDSWQSTDGLRDKLRFFEHFTQRYRASRIRETTTDESGRYLIDSLAIDGEWGVDGSCGANLLAYTPEHLGRKEYTVLKSGESHEVDLELKTFPDAVTYRARLLGPDGRPVADAVVGLFTPSSTDYNSLLDETDSDGVLELRLDKNCVTNLYAVSPTYGEALFQYVDIQPGGPYTLEWPEGATVTGRITWPDGAPAEGVEVLIAGRYTLEVPWQSTHSGPGHAASVFTDADGRYEFTGVPSPLDVSVQVYGSEETPISPIFNFGDLPVDRPFVWDYAIEAPIRLTGVAIGTTHNEPVPNVMLSALKDGEPVGGSTVTTDEDGRFAMELLAGQGRYTIYPHFKVPEEHTDNARFGESFLFGAGEEREIDLNITDPVTVRLQVTDTAGNGMQASGVLGLVRYDATGEDFTTYSNTESYFETNEDGFLDWTPVMPEQPFVIPLSADENYIRARTGPLAGEAGEVFDVHLTVYQKASLIGRAVDANGQPLARTLLRFTVDLPDRTQELPNERTDEDGWFYLDGQAPATDYTLTVWWEPNDGARIEAAPMRINAGAGDITELGDVVLKDKPAR